MKPEIRLNTPVWFNDIKKRLKKKKKNLFLTDRPIYALHIKNDEQQQHPTLHHENITDKDNKGPINRIPSGRQ